LFCKEKLLLAKSKEVKTGWSNLHQKKTSLKEISEEGYGSERAVLSMMIVIQANPPFLYCRRKFPHVNINPIASSVNATQTHNIQS
jgi:hypothetical protein